MSERNYVDEVLARTGEVPVSSVLASDDTGPEEPKPGFIGRLRAKGLDLRNTWQIVAGAILLPLGVAVILLGWAGAAHGRVDQQQIPYVISGGLLGLAGVIVGAFFFWAHWLYRIYDQADLHHQEAMREQTELMRSLLEALGHRPPEARAGAASNGSAPEYVATPTGTNFHTPACPVVASRQLSLRPVSAEEASHMRPCRICDPLAGAAGA